ncbi:uncharacterized protein [Cebidichthys violaceus]|uniref:uncharacterized protein n=1 Tax=Cebidichthys violaceus TaxID=271503 RepID=UPI0035CC76F7
MALIALCALFVFFSAGCHGKAAVVLIRESVTLTATESCTNGNFKLMTDDSEVTVATSVNGVWEPEKSYKGRIVPNSSSSVVLANVTINDNMLYEFVCSGDVFTLIQLEVIIPDDESVTEGEQVRLKSYSQTRGRAVKFIRWEKDGELVLQLERTSGLISYGTGFEEKNVSLSPDWNQTGDLSLIMQRVRTEDRGVYMCYTEEENGGKRRGNPAVRMEVTKRVPDQITAQTECPTQKMSTWTIVAIIEAVCIVVSAGLAAWYWFRSHRPSVSSGPGAERSDVELQPINGSAPPGSHGDGGLRGSTTINKGGGGGIYVINGDPVKFTTTEHCKKKEATLEHRLTADDTRLVARWDGEWKPGPGYKDRMSPNESVIFNSTNFNDDGLYELTCGSDNITQVYMVLSTNSSVTEGVSVSFPFFSVTAGKRGKFTVERDGKLVFLLDLPSGNVTHGAGFEERVSVSPEWQSQGDLTVTLKAATTGDQGGYLLYVQDEDNAGPRERLSAVRLRVHKRVPDQTSSSPPPVPSVTNQTQMESGPLSACWSAVGLTAAVVFIITVTVCFVIGWFMKTRSSRGTPGPGAAFSSGVGAALLNGVPPRGPPEADEGLSLEGSDAEHNV